MMAKISLILIRAYQMTLGPVLSILGRCRYEPSCSWYGYSAIQKYGFRRGWWLAIRRIARCAPWGGSGEDPVPETYVSWREARRSKHLGHKTEGTA